MAIQAMINQENAPCTQPDNNGKRRFDLVFRNHGQLQSVIQYQAQDTRFWLNFEKKNQEREPNLDWNPDYVEASGVCKHRITRFFSREISIPALVADYIAHPEKSKLACVYYIDTPNNRFGVLRRWPDPDCWGNKRTAASWRFFNLRDMMEAFPWDRNTPECEIWQDAKRLELETSYLDMPDIYIRGPVRLQDKDIQFDCPEEAFQYDMLQFYMSPCYDPDAIFGTNVCTLDNGDVVYAFAYFDLQRGVVADNLTVVVDRAGHYPDDEYKYPLTWPEKRLLLNKMEKAIMDAWGQSLTGFRNKYQEELSDEKEEEEKS